MADTEYCKRSWHNLIRVVKTMGSVSIELSTQLSRNLQVMADHMKQKKMTPNLSTYAVHTAAVTSSAIEDPARSGVVIPPADTFGVRCPSDLVKLSAARQDRYLRWVQAWKACSGHDRNCSESAPLGAYTDVHTEYIHTYSVCSVYSV